MVREVVVDLDGLRRLLILLSSVATTEIAVPLTPIMNYRGHKGRFFLRTTSISLRRQ